MNSPKELIVLLGENLNEVGTAPKLESHSANTPLHKGFSCYVFDKKGRFLVTRRALSKKVWPGVWTNSLCGHPGPDESHESAIKRRAREELGAKLTDIQIVIKDYRYKTPPYNGIIENELCPVFVARLVGNLHPNPDEVKEYMWNSWSDFVADIKNHPAKYAYWTKDQMRLLSNHSNLLGYAKSTIL